MEILNFKSFEVSAENRDAMKSSLTNDYDFNVVGKDATQKYKNVRAKHVGAWISKDDKEFFLAYLKDEYNNAPGIVCYITLEGAVTDSREKPYKTEDVKHEGKRDSDKCFVLYDDATNTELARVSTVKGKVKKVNKETGVEETVDGKIRPTKAMAKKAAQDLIMNGFHGKIRIDQMHEDTDPTVGYVTYTPSKGTKNGRWLAFGYERV